MTLALLLLGRVAVRRWTMIDYISESRTGASASRAARRRHPRAGTEVASHPFSPSPPSPLLSFSPYQPSLPVKLLSLPSPTVASSDLQQPHTAAAAPNVRLALLLHGVRPRRLRRWKVCRRNGRREQRERGRPADRSERMHERKDGLVHQAHVVRRTPSSPSFSGRSQVLTNMVPSFLYLLRQLSVLALWTDISCRTIQINPNDKQRLHLHRSSRRDARAPVDSDDGYQQRRDQQDGLHCDGRLQARSVPLSFLFPSVIRCPFFPFLDVLRNLTHAYTCTLATLQERRPVSQRTTEL